MYIALEGTKGVGKSTVLSQLKTMLSNDDVEFSSFCPTKAMPEHMWWEQAYTQYANDDDFINDLYQRYEEGLVAECQPSYYKNEAVSIDNPDDFSCKWWE